MTPSSVVAPIGKQIGFTCTYRAKNLTSKLDIVIENLNSGTKTKIEALEFSGGAQAVFYAAVGCVEQTIRCIILTKDETVVGSVSVTLVPGLNNNLQSLSLELAVIQHFLVHLE